LSPKMTVYAANQTTVLGSANGVGKYGTTLTVSNIAVTPGATYYVKVQGADNTVFSTGKYALELNLGTGSTPTAAPPNTQTANGNNLTSGVVFPVAPELRSDASAGDGVGGGGVSANMEISPVPTYPAPSAALVVARPVGAGADASSIAEALLNSSRP